MILAVTINFTVPGKPVSYKRVTHGKKPHYPPEYTDYRDVVSLIARSVMRGADYTEKPVNVVVKVYQPLEVTNQHSGDIDNYLKLIFDALNKIVFKDDKQVIQVIAYKYQDKHNPRVEVSVTDEL